MDKVEPGMIVPLSKMPIGALVEVDIPRRFRVWAHSSSRGQVRIEDDAGWAAWVSGAIHGEMIEPHDGKATSWVADKLGKPSMPEAPHA